MKTGNTCLYSRYHISLRKKVLQWVRVYTLCLYVELLKFLSELPVNMSRLPVCVNHVGGKFDLNNSFIANGMSTNEPNIRLEQELLEEQPQKKRKFDSAEIDTKIPNGIKNQGATCYLSSLIQVYYHLGKFRKVKLKI